MTRTSSRAWQRSRSCRAVFAARPNICRKDSQCAHVTLGMAALACNKFSTGELLFHDARVDSVTRSEHISNHSAEVQVCTCQFHITWRDGPLIGQHGTTGIETICLIQDSPLEDPVLKDFIDSARKSLEDRMGDFVNQGGSSGVNPTTSLGACPHHTDFPELMEVEDSDGSPHHEHEERRYDDIDSESPVGNQLKRQRSAELEYKIGKLQAGSSYKRRDDDPHFDFATWFSRPSHKPSLVLAMAVKRRASTEQRAKGLDFRSPNDDAWYSVRILTVEEGVLRVMYLNFPEEDDEWYFCDQFESSDQIEELRKRFRRPAEQLQDSQCGQVTEGMLVLACHTFSDGKLMFYDAVVDSVSRSKHRSNGASEEQVCTCQFRVTWRHGPVVGKHATVGTQDICLIQDSPIDDQSLNGFIVGARTSLKERMGSLVSQGRISSLNPAASSHGASPHPANVTELGDVNSSDGSQGHEEVGQSYEASKQEVGLSYEASKPKNKSGAGEAPTDLASEGLTNGQKECFFFWVDNLDGDIEPPKVVKFLQRELSVSSQVMLFPNLFLENTCSGAIYVEVKEHANRVLKLLNSDNIVVSSKGRPWVTNRKCCGILHCPMPWQEMNLDTENQDDVTEIRVLRPGSEGYEEASKIHAIFKVHCDRIEELQESLKLNLCNMLANGSRSRPRSSK